MMPSLEQALSLVSTLMMVARRTGPVRVGCHCKAPLGWSARKVGKHWSPRIAVWASPASSSACSTVQLGSSPAWTNRKSPSRYSSGCCRSQSISSSRSGASGSASRYHWDEDSRGPRRRLREKDIVIAEDCDGRRAEFTNVAQHLEGVGSTVDEVADKPEAVLLRIN